MEWWIYALGASLSFTIFQIIRKKGLSKSHAMNFESLRTIFVFILCLCLLPFTDWSFNKNYIFLAYLVSLTGTMGILLAAKAFRHSDISLISPLGNLRPAFVAILASIFLSETLGFKEIIGICILLISAYLLESNHSLTHFLAPIKSISKSKYSIYYIIAMLLFSCVFVLDKFIITTKITNIYTYLFLVWAFIAINFNIVHAIMYGFKDIVVCLKQTTYLTFAVAFFSILGNILAYKALSMAYASLVMPIVMLSTLLVVLFGGRFFHEKLLIFRMSISAFMLIGAYLIII